MFFPLDKDAVSFNNIRHFTYKIIQFIKNDYQHLKLWMCAVWPSFVLFHIVDQSIEKLDHLVKLFWPQSKYRKELNGNMCW